MIKEGIKGLDLKGLAGEKEECKVVLFNVVDEGEMRLGDIKEVIGSVCFFFSLLPFSLFFFFFTSFFLEVWKEVTEFCFVVR